MCTDSERRESNPHSLQELSDFIYSVKYLNVLMDSLHYYPKLVDRSDLMRLHRLLADYVDTSLSSREFVSLQKIYDRPEFTSDGPPESLGHIFAACFTWLAPRIKGESFDITKLNQDEMATIVDDTLLKAKKHLSEDLLQAVNSVNSAMVLDCLVPCPSDMVEFKSESRAAFLLSEYWNLFSEYVIYLSTAKAWFKPDPMLPLRTSLKLRINTLMEMLSAHGSCEPIERLLNWPVEEIDAVPEYIHELVDASSEFMESVRTIVGHSSFSFVAQERMFFESFRHNFQTNRSRAEKHFSDILRRMKETSPNSSRAKDHGQPPSCFDYIRMVERRLRDIVKRVYVERFGENWLSAIRESLGQDAYDAAVRTMNQRGITDAMEMLHFTNLPDLQQAVTKKWELFGVKTHMRKQEFNKLFAPILKGRTEEAHNRPDYLWPEIEQQRVRVACSDLLKHLDSEK